MSGTLTGRQFTRVMREFENKRNRAKMREIRRARRLERESRRARRPRSRAIDEDALEDVSPGTGEGGDREGWDGDPRD